MVTDSWWTTSHDPSKSFLVRIPFPPYYST